MREIDLIERMAIVARIPALMDEARKPFLEEFDEDDLDVLVAVKPILFTEGDPDDEHHAFMEMVDEARGGSIDQFDELMRILHRDASELSGLDRIALQGESMPVTSEEYRCTP